MDFLNIALTDAKPSLSKATNKPLTLREGQMVHGKIQTLFPGQMAEVQIGSERVIAKLEVPLQAGNSYYFQVQPGEGELQLKIIAGPTSTTASQAAQLSQLVEAMNLPKTTEMRTLLSFIMKNEIPMSRESLIQAEQFLKSVSKEKRTEALHAIRRAIQLELPMKENILRAIQQTQSREGIQTGLQSLKEGIMRDSTIPQNIRNSVLSSMNQISEPFQEATSRAVLGNLLLRLTSESESSENRFAAMQLLKREGVLPQATSLANVSQVLTNMAETNLPERTAQAVKQMTQVGGQQMSQNMNETVVQMIRNLAENTVARPFTSPQTFPQEPLQALFSRNVQEEALPRLFTAVQQQEVSQVEGQARSQPLHAPLTTVLQASEAAVSNALDGEAMKSAMQMVTRSLGFNYEAMLAGRDPNVTQLLESLKPQLVELMQNESLSPAVRESAELLVSRLNGTVILSGENGVQHQLITQVPIEIFNHQIDATLEWNGKMKEDGKIDPDFARILFYLDLYSLQETVVDMQVQNRIVSISIYNDTPALKTFGASLEQNLKKGLEKVGYQLSGVFFKPYTKDETVDQPSLEKPTKLHGGVDFRV